jgi:hypothetical protein
MEAQRVGRRGGEEEAVRDRRGSRPIRSRLLVLAVALAGAGAACGGGGGTTRTYDVSAAPYTFSYPKAFDETSPNTGAEFVDRPPTWKFAIGIDGANVVVAETYTIRRAGESYKPDAFATLVAAAARQIAKNNGSTVTRTSTGRLGGLASHVYDLSENDGGLASRLVFAFRGRTEYFVRCQWDEEGAKLVRPACQDVVSTLRVKKPGT